MSVQEIIQGCISEEAKYQRLLVVNYSSMLLAVSRRYTPISADAEDVLQDAFIKIFGAIKQFDPARGALESWMRKIVINTALQRLNKKCFTHEKTVERFEEIQLHPTVYDHLQADDIMKLIDTLPDGYRQVFNLAVVEDYPHKEIAALLNIEVATSRSNLSKAKKLLRNKLDNQKKQELWTRIG
ncbi:MAG: RNA polymerase sigma factor [Saprospiraceae bacterium]